MCYWPGMMSNIEYWPSSFFVLLWTKMKLRSITLQKKEANIQPFWGYNRVQRKSLFAACHLGKLKLAFTNPEVISTSAKNFLTSRIDFTVLLLFEFVKKHYLTFGKLKTEFTSRIAKSTSSWLSTLLSLHHFKNNSSCPLVDAKQGM